MSAIQTTCPKCRAIYVVGVVGTWTFPAHVCPKPASNPTQGEEG